MTARSHQQTMLKKDGDPFFAQVLVLLHGNGANGGTSFPDATGRTWTLNSGSGTTTSTAQSKWGGSSILVGSTMGAGTTGGIQTAHDSVFNFWNGSSWNPTTIEFWKYGTSFANYSTDYSYGNNASGALLLQPPPGGAQNIYTAGLLTGDESTADTANAWVHHAIVIDTVSNAVFIYRDGVKTYGAAGSGIIFNAITSGSFPLSIGAIADGSYAVAGYLQDIRITAACRYPAGTTFAVPTGPFLDY